MVVSDNNQLQKFKNDDVAQYYFEILHQLIAKKSIFAQQIGLAEVANYLGDTFTEAGAEVTTDDICTAPFVLACSKSNRPDARMIIFYNHYDTVSADDDQPWSSDPFELTVRDDYMYGRGVDDDKGHITARLIAVQKYRHESGDFPVDIISIMEGSEESASVGLETYLEKYVDKLRGADLLVWEQGISNTKDQIEISGGAKGVVTFDMVVDSAKVDVHSKLGAVIESASWYLLNAIASLRDETSRILVDGIYDQVIEPNERELSLILEHANFDADNLKTLYGLNLPMLTRNKEKLVRTLFFEPAITVEGTSAGYQGQGARTILPAKAQAKMEVRLVPGLEPKDVLQKIEQHLQQHGFEQVELVYTLGEKAYRSDMPAPTILNVIEIAKVFSPNGISVLPTTAGTGPMYQFFEALEVPIASSGIDSPDSRDHAGDENVNLADYYTHIEMIGELVKSYDKTDC